MQCGVVWHGIQYSPANAVDCSQGYHPLEPEMLLLSALLFDSPKGFYSLLCTLFSLLLFYPPRPVGTPPWEVGELWFVLGNCSLLFALYRFIDFSPFGRRPSVHYVQTCC